jgi:2-octaprenylphenol hydroxylase
VSLQRTDVAIVGAGMAGAALAALLAAQGLDVLLCEAAEPQAALPSPPACIADVDPRVSAINVASRSVLEAAGAWSALPDAARCAYQAMRVWEEDGTGRISFDASDIGASELGYLVENRWITAALLRTRVRVKKKDGGRRAAAIVGARARCRWSRVEQSAPKVSSLARAEGLNFSREDDGTAYVTVTRTRSSLSPCDTQ